MGRVYERICAVQALIAATLLVLMVLLIFLGGVMRALGEPINWSNDAATALFAWACFLCADIAWRKNALMSIDLVTARLPHGARRLLTLCNYAIIIVFLVYVLIGGLYLSWISRARSFQGIPEVSYSWVTLSMPFGAVLLLITAFLKVREEIVGGSQASEAAPDAGRAG